MLLPVPVQSHKMEPMALLFMERLAFSMLITPPLRWSAHFAGNQMRGQKEACTSAQEQHGEPFLQYIILPETCSLLLDGGGILCKTSGMHWL